MVDVLTNQLKDLSRIDLTLIPPAEDGSHDGLKVSFSPDAATSNDVAEFQKVGETAMSNEEIAARMLVAFAVKWNLRRMIPVDGTESNSIVDETGAQWKADENDKPLSEPVPVTVADIMAHVGVKSLGTISSAIFEAITPKAPSDAS